MSLKNICNITLSSSCFEKISRKSPFKFLTFLVYDKLLIISTLSSKINLCIKVVLKLIFVLKFIRNYIFNYIFVIYSSFFAKIQFTI